MGTGIEIVRYTRSCFFYVCRRILTHKFFSIASSPASIVHIKILHHSSISRPKLISELLSKVQRLVDGKFSLIRVPEDSLTCLCLPLLVFTHDLLMHGIRTGRISLTATIAPNAQAPDPLNLANIEGERALVAFSRSDVSGSQPSKISEIADRVPPVSPELLAPFVSPLGQALNSLQRLVEIIDGVAEVCVCSSRIKRFL
jgi:hypothetical protein